MFGSQGLEIYDVLKDITANSTFHFQYTFQKSEKPENN